MSSSFQTRAKSSAFQTIPVVDISGLYSDSLDDRQKTAAQLAHAAEHVGFLYVSGHQISAAKIDALLAVAKGYFAQPFAEKMRSYIGQSSNHSGYVPEGEERFYGEQLDPSKVDHKEAYDIGFELDDVCLRRPMLGHNQWPAYPDFKEAVSDYYAEALALGQTLFRGFALALGLPEDWFVKQAQRPPSQLRLVHYPYSAGACDREGIGAHTDYECFTLLLPTSDGLEVLNGDGDWIDAPVLPNCFVVNIGDMMETLSNGRFVATSHRVRKVKQERYSFPLFCSLNYDCLIEPIIPAGDTPGDREYPSLVCGEHLYAQTIQTFHYLQQKLQRGEIQLPPSFESLATFGKLRNTEHHNEPGEGNA